MYLDYEIMRSAIKDIESKIEREEIMLNMQKSFNVNILLINATKNRIRNYKRELKRAKEELEMYCFDPRSYDSTYIN